MAPMVTRGPQQPLAVLIRRPPRIPRCRLESGQIRSFSCRNDTTWLLIRRRIRCNGQTQQALVQIEHPDERRSTYTPVKEQPW